MYEKNDLVTVNITDMGNEGEGIGKLDSFPFFIKDAIIGDTVEAKVLKVKKNYAFARLEKIIEASDDRIEAPCPVARPCGGCQIQAMSYESQLRFKENKVKNNLIRIGGVDASYLNEIFEPIMGMEKPWRYRNKAQYPVSVDKNGNIVAGFYAGRTHSVIACTDCLIGSAKNKPILETLISWMQENRIRPYDEETGEGVVRHILIKEGFATGEIMVVLVVNKSVADVPAYRDGGKGIYDKLVKALLTVDVNSVHKAADKVPGKICSIQLNENKEKTNVILGKRCALLYGKEYIEDTLMGHNFRISPLSFYQVNPHQTKKLYSTAIEFADLKGDEEVWDICCGIGTITLSLADNLKANADKNGVKCGCVHGLEIVPQAIDNAKDNAVRNKIENVDFVCAAAEEYMPANRNHIHADVIVTDPPRKGMDEKSLEVMVSMAPEKIVYVSCDSATLARDVKYLTQHGYELKRVRACDMFSHSVHVESVVLITRKEK